LSESEASPEVERATTKKGNPKPPRNLKGRKKNVKGRGNANGKSKKKACVEAEGDLLVAELTSELEDDSTHSGREGILERLPDTEYNHPSTTNII
jgi:hypothetical protein